MADEGVAGLDQNFTSLDQIDRGSSGVHPAYIGQLEGASGPCCIQLAFFPGSS